MDVAILQRLDSRPREPRHYSCTPRSVAVRDEVSPPLSAYDLLRSIIHSIIEKFRVYGPAAALECMHHRPAEHAPLPSTTSISPAGTRCTTGGTATLCGFRFSPPCSRQAGDLPKERLAGHRFDLACLQIFKRKCISTRLPSLGRSIRLYAQALHKVFGISATGHLHDCY